MPDIRYVCVSDTHLGANNSLLTNLKTASSDVDASEPSPVMKRLVECLRYLISENEGKEKPTLILAGDILELALADTNQALMVFQRFIELIMPEGDELFDKKVIFLPGNHDHHLWEVARETQYVNYITGKSAPSGPLPVPWHTTNMFKPTLVPAYMLTQLVQKTKHLEDMVFATAYPNYGLLAKQKQKCVIIHHGHFVEPIYQLMSTLNTYIFPDSKLPDRIWEVEAENFAWIDFFWSAMGRSDQVGEDVELIYEKMQDPDQFKKLLTNLAGSLARRYDLPGWGDRIEAKILTTILHIAVDRMAGLERAQPDRPLSASAEKGLWAYMIGPLQDQILTELKANMPGDMTFIFGHTHKPFQEDMNFRGYPQWVNVYNTGGWVIDTVQAKPFHGGAVVMLDENLDAASIHMFHEHENPADYAVTVQEAAHIGEAQSPLYARLTKLVKPAEPPWSTFSTSVSRAARVRAQNLRARINSMA
jgi:hypothetical protein